MPPAEVTILGGGLGGMAAALALARAGIGVDLYEQAPALTAVGAGIQLSPNGTFVLARLGLLDRAAAVADTPSAIQFRDAASGRKLARVPLGFPAVLRWGYPYWQFHRVDLLDLLAEAGAEAGVRIHTGKVMLRVQIEGEKAVLEFADGSLVSTRCLIAADGIRSQVRTQLFDDSPLRFTGHVAWRALIPADALKKRHPTVTMVHIGPGAHTVSYPIAGSTLINFVAVEEREAWAPEGWSIAGRHEELLRRFGSWPEPVAELVAEAHKTYLWGLFDHPPLDLWSKGPVVLMGDAAHPVLPFFAQGAALALEDALVLARELKEKPDLASAFAGFERARKTRALRVRAMSLANGKIYHAAGLKGLGVRAGMVVLAHSHPAGFHNRHDWIFRYRAES